MKASWVLASAICAGAYLVGSGASVSALSGCIMPSSTTSDSGTSPITIASDGGTLSASATGTGCGTDPTTGVTLCTGMSECPGVTVDQSVFTECGFFIDGPSIYIACLCSDYLCPLGQPSTCSQAASLLASSNEGTVCGEVNNNACTALMSGSGTTDSGSGITTDTGSGITADVGSGSGGCDTTCESMCGGDPDCIQLCGC